MRALIDFKNRSFAAVSAYPRVSVSVTPNGVLVTPTWAFGPDARTVTVRADRKLASVTLSAEQVRTLGFPVGQFKAVFRANGKGNQFKLVAVEADTAPDAVSYAKRS